MSKTLTVAASVGEAVFALLYGMSKSAESATVRSVHGLTSHCTASGPPGGNFAQDKKADNRVPLPEFS
jgi:hypothetical protein